MPIPAALIAAIANALIEAAGQSSPQTLPPYEYNAIVRSVPEKAKQGYMLPPPGNGTIIIDGVEMPLSVVSQFRSEQNLIVMPFSIQRPSDVVYITDASGAIYRVWMLNPTEAATRAASQ